MHLDNSWCISKETFLWLLYPWDGKQAFWIIQNPNCHYQLYLRLLQTGQIWNPQLHNSGIYWGCLASRKQLSPVSRILHTSCCRAGFDSGFAQCKSLSSLLLFQLLQLLQVPLFLLLLYYYCYYYPVLQYWLNAADHYTGASKTWTTLMLIQLQNSCCSWCTALIHQLCGSTACRVCLCACLRSSYGFVF